MRDFGRRIGLATALGVAAVLTGIAAPAQAGTASPRTAEHCGTTADDARNKGTANCLDEARPSATTPMTADDAPTALQTAGGDERNVCGPPYVHGDPRLGPKYLPHSGYLGYVLRGYERYGGISPTKFIYRYWDETATPPGWRFPPDQGFAHDGGYVNGRPLRSRTTLRVGQLVDRFGSEFGMFLAPGGTAFGERALPPDSLNTRADDPKHLCNYHLYRVIKSFDVDAGPIEPAFQQPGKGLQYVLVSAYVPGAPNPLSVGWLADHGYLERVN